jgi:hypothetical protein
VSEANILGSGEAMANYLLDKYKREAAKRDIEFTLTREQFKTLTSSNCHYCDIPPYRITQKKNANGGYTYNGVDRQDNNLGYVPANCVPCCKICNIAKNNQSHIDFEVWLERAYRHMILKSA